MKPERYYYELLTELQTISGKNEKIRFLHKHKNDEGLIKYLTFLFDFRITTGLAEKKIKKKINGTYTQEFADIFAAMEYFSLNNTGTDKDVLNLQHFLNTICEDSDMQKFYEQLFTKKLKLGVQVDTINSAFGKLLIHSFACQLAHPLHDAKIPKEMAVTTKLDGNRMLVEVTAKGEDLNIQPYTRKGLPIDGLGEIVSDISELVMSNSYLNFVLKEEGGFVLDGEVIVTDQTIPKHDQFQETMKIVRKKGDKKGLSYHVFDLIDYEGFYLGESGYPYEARRTALELSFDRQYQYLKLVPVLAYTSDLEEVMKIAKEAFDNQEEGVMINDLAAKYVTKRTYGLMKVKEFKTADVLVTGIYEGTGKNEGSLGGLNLLCVLPTGEEFTTNLGSGLTDEHRETFWKHPEQIIGKIVEVQYQGITENQNKQKGLRFPTLKGIRFDKTSREDINMEV